MYFETPESVGVGLPRRLRGPDPYGGGSAGSSVYEEREGVRPVYVV